MEAAIRSCAARISSILTGSADASAGIVFCWFICVTLYDRKRDISTAIRSGVGRKQALCRPDGKNRIYRPWNNGRTHGGASCQGGARRHGFQSLDGEDPGMGGETWRRSSRQSGRSEEHTSELQSLMRISYAVFCLTKKQNNIKTHK